MKLSVNAKVQQHATAASLQEYVTYISKLNGSNLTEVDQAIMRSIFIHNEGDILHRFGTEPSRHLGLIVISITSSRSETRKNAIDIVAVCALFQRLHSINRHAPTVFKKKRYRKSSRARLYSYTVLLYQVCTGVLANDNLTDN